MVNRYVDEIIIHGSPSKVIDKLHELNETISLDYLLASILSHESFIRLTDEILPNLKSWNQYIIQKNFKLFLVYLDSSFLD